MKRSKHTRRLFKDKIKDMTTKQREECLQELQMTLIGERAKAQQGIELLNMRELRKQIAILKTILHHPGYHYHPREGTE
jgi:ribosomal protein L29